MSKFVGYAFSLKLSEIIVKKEYLTQNIDLECGNHTLFNGDCLKV